MHSKFSFIFYCNIHTAGSGLISEWAKYPVQLKKDPIFVAYDISEQLRHWLAFVSSIKAFLILTLVWKKKKKNCPLVERNLISWTKSNKHGNSQFEKNMTVFQTRSISDFKFVKLTIESLDLERAIK